MIVKMRFLNISGPRDDIDRVCEKYLSKYEMQIENAVTELKTTENIMPFVEVNPYRDPLTALAARIDWWIEHPRERAEWSARYARHTAQCYSVCSSVKAFVAMEREAIADR